VITLYVSYYTADELKSQIDAVQAAINTVIAGGRSYRLNDGMGDVQVTRETLANLKSYRNELIAEYNDLVDDAGIVSIEVGR
jgi:hypothetical protein